MKEFTAHLRFTHFNLKLFLFKSVVKKRRGDILHEGETTLTHKHLKEIKISTKVQKWKNIEVQICPMESRIVLKAHGLESTISLEDVKYLEIHPKKVLEVRYSF